MGWAEGAPPTQACCLPTPVNEYRWSPGLVRISLPLRAARAPSPSFKLPKLPRVSRKHNLSKAQTEHCLKQACCQRACAPGHLVY